MADVNPCRSLGDNMNANEIADKLEQGHWEGGTREQAATMLRQQQAEIEALKKEAALQRLSDFTQEVEKTLTDEEIEEVFRTVEQDFALTESKKSDGGWRNFPVELGRAILRKAQEKC